MLEYSTHVIQGDSAYYVFWFDRKQITSEAENAIMQSLRSDDFSDELNQLLSEKNEEILEPSETE